MFNVHKLYLQLRECTYFLKLCSTGGSFVSKTVTRGQAVPFLSPYIDLKHRPKCITFWYQLYRGDSVKIEVYSVTENNRILLTKMSVTNIENNWTEITVYTEIEETFQVNTLYKSRSESYSVLNVRGLSQKFVDNRHLTFFNEN